MVHQIVYLYVVRNKGRVIRRTMIRINKDKGLYGEFEKINPNNNIIHIYFIIHLKT
jgi:hypothetical protein